MTKSDNKTTFQEEIRKPIVNYEAAAGEKQYTKHKV